MSVNNTSKQNDNALHSLATLNQLILEAGLRQDFDSLVFHMLNRSVVFFRNYDRAFLISLPELKILGVSGTANHDRHSPLISRMSAMAKDLAENNTCTIVTNNMFTDNLSIWEDYTAKCGGISVIWLPVVIDGKIVAALWLERWRGVAWTDGEAKSAFPLMAGYAMAWRIFKPVKSNIKEWIHKKATKKNIYIASAIVLFLLLMPVPLRIIAPCEIVPDAPFPVTTRTEGVIDKILVKPGDTVKKDQLLAVFDQKVALEKLKEARQEVLVAYSNLKRARVQSLTDDSVKAELPFLENRLKQERTRLEIAKLRVAHLEIRAPRDGTVMMDDPHKWQGKTVIVGERILTLVDPMESKLYIRLPQDDKIDFPKDAEVKAVLNTDASGSYEARLSYLANHAEHDATGLSFFPAEAEWLEKSPNFRIGVQGTAVIYGRWTPLSYWLLRRPLAAFRRFFGI